MPFPMSLPWLLLACSGGLSATPSPDSDHVVDSGATSDSARTRDSENDSEPTPRDTEADTDPDSGTADPHPTLDDLWLGTAHFVEDLEHGPFGPASFHFFSSFWDEADTLWAYYIHHGERENQTGLATSSDGLEFEDHFRDHFFRRPKLG